jgi:hypothetical protein
VVARSPLDRVAEFTRKILAVSKREIAEAPSPKKPRSNTSIAS